MIHIASGTDNHGNEESSSLAELLVAGVASLALPVSSEAQRQLLTYLVLLQKWNKAYNLSAIRDPQQMLIRHVLDSLSIAPYLQGNSFVDVGTGAGLPGIPLAICFPDRHFVLLDSNGKKTRFLTQVKHDLVLENITVVQSRVEDYRPGRPVDGVLSRAFASLDAMLASSRHLLPATPGVGYFYAMKGQLPTTELSALNNSGYRVEDCIPLQIPMLAGERHLIVLAAQQPSD